MISLKRIIRKGLYLPVKGRLDTSKKVQEARRRLEEATKDSFTQYRLAGINAMRLAKETYLD